MKFGNRVLTFLAALIVGITVWAAPAYAAWECSNPSFCVWDLSDGTGARYYWTEVSTPPPSGCVNVGGWWNDEIGSAYNRSTNKMIWVYRVANCAAPNSDRLAIYPGQKKWGSDMNIYAEQISSFFYAYCPYTADC